MNNDNDSVLKPTPSFVSRVVNNDSFRKGIGTAVAGVLVAVAIEAIWGGSDS